MKEKKRRREIKAQNEKYQQQENAWQKEKWANSVKVVTEQIQENHIHSSSQDNQIKTNDKRKKAKLRNFPHVFIFLHPVGFQKLSLKKNEKNKIK